LYEQSRPSGTARIGAKRHNRPNPAPDLSSDRGKWLGGGLAGERIFHIGNVMDVATVP
jgi:hypothetical protein